MIGPPFVTSFDATTSGIATAVAALKPTPRHRGCGVRIDRVRATNMRSDPVTNGKGAVQTLGRAARSLADVRCQQPEPLGFFGAMRAMGNPDVQRALGFMVAVGTAFGAQMGRGPLCGPESQLTTRD